jgi:hypothetical protein
MEGRFVSMVTGIYGFDTVERTDFPTSGTTLADHARNDYFARF